MESGAPRKLRPNPMLVRNCQLLNHTREPRSKPTIVLHKSRTSLTSSRSHLQWQAQVTLVGVQKHSLRAALGLHGRRRCLDRVLEPRQRLGEDHCLGRVSAILGVATRSHVDW